MPKPSRSEVHAKYEGRCAYCGQEIPLKGFHVDHREPCWRGWNGALGRGKDPNDYTLEELEPACARCNRWKSVHSVEQFREELQIQAKRLRRDSAAFRLAEDFGVVSATENPVVFYFERYRSGEE